MKKLIAVITIIILLICILPSCEREPKSEYTKYTKSFFDTFDTLTRVIAYTKTEEEFNYYTNIIQARLQELHKYYDKYNDYDGINNIKTINDNAGIKPVKVEKEIIDLILFSKNWYNSTAGKTNIAMGSVLKIWHDYREAGEGDPQNAKLPPMEKLLEAEKYIDIDNVIVDIDNSTVFLTHEKMSLDVGAVAKGYATELVAREIMDEGLESGIISTGGNIRVLGKPRDGIRERWGIGIQNPDKSIITDEENVLDIVFLNNASVVSSGDYQRYYIVDGKVMHHLIDPDTLMPGEYYRAVTVITEDAGIADLLSTSIFLMSYEEGSELIEILDGVEAIWVMIDGEVIATDGAKKIMKSQGATGAKSE